MTPCLAVTEQHIAAMADDPVLAMQSLLARNFGQYSLRKLGLLNNGEYAVSIAGDCMG